MTDTRFLILKYALPLVPFDGWSDYTLSQATARAGLKPDEARHTFPAGVADLIDYYFTQEDEALAKAFSEDELKEKRIPERIGMLILARLGRFAANREAVRRAVAHRALPWNSFRACCSLTRTVDLMWRLAGDTSIDFSYYTKRATLAALYSSTLLYWLNDDSEHMDKTSKFLKRRLSGLAAFGKMKKDLKKKFSAA